MLFSANLFHTPFDRGFVVKTAAYMFGLLVLLGLTLGAPAEAQSPRMQFPSSVPAAQPIPNPLPGTAVPTATLDGTIQSLPPGWDPYAPPGSAPPALFPQDPYLPYGGPYGGAGDGASPGGTYATMRRFLDELRFDYVWIPGTAPDELGVHDVELSATFAIPFLYNTQTPLLVTPGFAIHYWNGPVSVGPPPTADLPAQTFDAYLDTAWNPQLTSWLRADLAVRIGVYSDFEKVVEESIRLQGRGMMILTFSPSMEIAAGVWYLDRNSIKLLPAGGIIWTPNPDTRFEILFPNPKLARRLADYGNTQWWWYLRGEYGGGNWTVRRTSGIIDEVDYNDIRAAVGVEFIRLNGLTGLFEVGVTFEREVVYKSMLPPTFNPNSTVFLRSGLTY